MNKCPWCSNPKINYEEKKWYLKDPDEEGSQIIGTEIHYCPFCGFGLDDYLIQHNVDTKYQDRFLKK